MDTVKARAASEQCQDSSTSPTPRRTFYTFCADSRTVAAKSKTKTVIAVAMGMIVPALLDPRMSPSLYARVKPNEGPFVQLNSYFSLLLSQHPSLDKRFANLLDQCLPANSAHVNIDQSNILCSSSHHSGAFTSLFAISSIAH